MKHQPRRTQRAQRDAGLVFFASLCILRGNLSSERNRALANRPLGDHNRGMSTTTINFYPPAPASVPADLAEPGAEYERQARAVLTSLLVFVGIHFGLLFISAAGIVVSLFLIGPVAPLGIIGLILSSVFFLFFVKALFKRQRKERSLLIEITEEEHPRLFAFIRQLADEVGAPFPKAVFVTPEVNAAVFYDSSFFNLLVPVEKNLLIGLGLVNVMRLDEFKAILAHEFGHFSQKSMALGSYVYIAKRVIADMVYGRDFWDDWLRHAKHLDLRIAIFAWLIHGIVWVLRKPMELAFTLISHRDAKLSREMEFHADRVAVSMAGSDALVHSLARLDFANDCLSQAADDLAQAKDHGLYSRDLFHHQTEAIQYLRQVRRKPGLGQMPALPADPRMCIEVFTPKDNGVPCMYATHPGNYDREQNAKRVYLRSPLDARSPWLLFNEPEKLREKVTRRFYRLVHSLDKRTPLHDPREVQKFIDAEHAETMCDPKYQGLYDQRLIDPGDLAEAIREVERQPLPMSDVLLAQELIITPALAQRLKQHFQRREEYGTLAQVHVGAIAPEGGEFEFRKKHYDVEETKKLLKRVDQELKQDQKELAAVDRRVFLLHYRMAQEAGETARSELLTRYRFHIAIQEIAKTLAESRTSIENVVGFLQEREEVSNDDIAECVDELRKARDGLVKSLLDAHKITLPPLSNLAAGAPLSEYLFDGTPVKDIKPTAGTIRGPWVVKLMEQILEVHERVRRIHFKSLGALLRFQEGLVEGVRQAESATPFAEPVD
jgi:Zn-dependent protease with chaperone function